MLDIDLIDGRFYDGGEGDAMLVNEAAAQLIWGRQDVAGETLPISISDADNSEIVGVIADVSHEHPEADVEPRIYVPILPSRQSPRATDPFSSRSRRIARFTRRRAHAAMGPVYSVRCFKWSSSDVE